LAMALAFLFGMLYARSRCRPHQLGLSWTRWPANLGVGLLATIVVTPVVLGLHQLAIGALGGGDHPLVLAAKDIKQDWLWWLIGFQLVIAAPILEEIVFRGVLLGWLRRASLAGHLGVITATILWAVAQKWIASEDAQDNALRVGPIAFACTLGAIYGFWMVRLVRQFQLREEEIQAWLPLPRHALFEGAAPIPEDLLPSWREKNARLAIFGSAMLFAIFHMDAWPAPIAIFLLALILGALATRTQSLLGPITLHMAFNLVSFIGLFGSTFQADGANGNAATSADAPSIFSSVPASQLPRRK
jgi:membrane protease YdiL (CAAX protease family)